MTCLVIGHRGASGYRPEHTLESYRLAVEMGADYIEPDLVSTGDGVLVARHENQIGATTDVTARAEFADRRTAKCVDGRAVTGWFTEDFTLAELKTLRAVERLPEVRRSNTRYDGQFEVPTFDEILALAQREGARRGVTVGVYPETKHPSYFDSIGLGLDDPLVDSLTRHHLDRPNAPVFVQSFETENLRRLRARLRVPLVQLIDVQGAPYDLVARGDRRGYADLGTPAGLREVATYADAVGVHKELVLRGGPLVRDAHSAGLHVHAWTVRVEQRFLTRRPCADGGARAGLGAAQEARALVAAGVDGIFTDHPDRVVAALPARVPVPPTGAGHAHPVAVPVP